MIPMLVPKRQLLSANGIFTLTLNAAFALGFTLLGPLIVKIAGAPALIAVVAALYFVAAVFCWTLPPAPPALARGRPAVDPGPRPRGGGRRSATVVDPAPRGPRLHPRPPRGPLVADLPRRSRPRSSACSASSGPAFAAEDARPEPGGLRRHRPAARRRDRDGDPPAQRLRPADPAPAGHRGRPDRPRHPPRAHGPVRPDQRVPRPPDLGHGPAGPVAR